MTDTYWLLGTRLRVLAAAADTAGRYDLVEGWLAPGTPTPAHLHRRYSEQLYVLEGEYTVWVEGRTLVLRAGDMHLIPAGARHWVAATGGGPARGVVVASPSGFARLITEAGTPDDGSGHPPATPPDVAHVLRVSAELGDELVPPGG